MKRREAIKKTALLMGYAVSAGAVAGVMSGCQADESEGWKPKAFSDVQMKTLREVCERILPATEGIVGAKDVMVHRFIDELYHTCFKADKVAAFKKGLDLLETDAHSTYNKAFAKLSSEEMDGEITKIAERAIIERKAIKHPKLMANYKRKDLINPFFSELREATMLGFFTSEKVGTDVLNYDPIPGGYNGCLPLSEVPNGRNWSF